MRRWAWHAGIATAVVVGLQVLLPRLFSVILWYHLGFLAVSLAMLGLALGGLLVRNRVFRSGKAGGGIDLSRLATWSSAALCLSLILVVRVPIDPTRLLDSVTHPVLLLVTGLLLAVPFTLLGTLTCACLDLGKARIGLLYGATFFGGAGGALLSLYFMNQVGAPRAAGLLALLPLLGSVRDLRRGSRWAALLLVVAICALPDAMLPLTSRKHFPQIPRGDIIDEQWNSFSHVTFYENPEHHGLWEIGKPPSGRLPESIGVAIDSWAITSILKAEGDGATLRFLDRYPPTVAYAGAPAGFEALVIGAGGGVDVLAALQSGAGRVTAVEINPLIVAAVRGRFREFSGSLYDDPRVEVVVAEGRHFIENDRRRYDRIVLIGVDTFAATEAGAFALSENYLYTVEALTALYRHLKPGGILALARWWFEPPRQTLRLTVTATEALGALGIADLSQRVIIARSGLNSLFLLKQGEFTPAERNATVQACLDRGAALVHPAAQGQYPLYEQALTVAGAREVVRAHPYRVDATTDERPFFFENDRFSRLFRGEGDWIHGRLGGQELLVLTLVVLLLRSLPLGWSAWTGGGGRALDRRGGRVPG
ncbi:MAG: hypothetical protein ABIG68_07780, partial [Acidobacteriota bacterium]